MAKKRGAKAPKQRGQDSISLVRLAAAAGHALAQHPSAALLAYMSESGADAADHAATDDDRAFASRVAGLDEVNRSAIHLGDAGPALHEALARATLHGSTGVIAHALLGTRELAGTTDTFAPGLLLPEEVREVAEHLASLGTPIEDTPGPQRLLKMTFDQVLELYRDAAAAGDAVLVRFQMF
jgi:hypothetical protein